MGREKGGGFASIFFFFNNALFPRSIGFKFYVRMLQMSRLCAGMSPMAKKARTELFPLHVLLFAQSMKNTVLAKKFCDECPGAKECIENLGLTIQWLDHCHRLTEYAITSDKNYVGQALATTMINLGLVIKYVLSGHICGATKKEAEELVVHVDVLSGGAMTMEGFVRGEVGESAKYVYRWLTCPISRLRAMLRFLSNGGFYLRRENLLEAYIVSEQVSETDFIDVCVFRLCQVGVVRSEDGPIVWNRVRGAE